MWRFRPNFPNNLYLAKIGFNKSLRSLFRYSGQIPQIWPDPTKSLILRQKRLAQARISQSVYLEPKWLRWTIGCSLRTLPEKRDPDDANVSNPCIYSWLFPRSLSPLWPETLMFINIAVHLCEQRRPGCRFPVDLQDNSSSWFWEFVKTVSCEQRKSLQKWSCSSTVDEFSQ